MQIKLATEADAHTLTTLAKATFTDTFAKDNAPENMEYYVQKNFSVDIQLAEIQDPHRRIFIAWSGSVATGFLHLHINSPDPAIKGENPIELLRLYVDSNWQGQGVGHSLLKKGIAIAREEGFQTLWLGVWERNFKAQAFYRQFGFTKVGQHIFQLGDDAQTDWILSLPL